MWNFTVRGAIIPNCDDIQHLLRDATAFEQLQKDLALLKAEDLNNNWQEATACHIQQMN